MVQSVLTSKGQTTIPQEIREAMNLRAGDQLTYELRGKEITIRVTPGLSSAAGSLKGKVRRRPQSIAKMRETALRAISQHSARRGLINR